MMTERIVVRSTNWVGDAIMTTPVYRALRSNYPDAWLTVVARPWVANLLEGNPNIDELIPETRGGLRGAVATGRRLRRTGSLDIGIALPNSFSSALSLRLGGVRRRVGFDLQHRRALLTDPISLPGWLLQEHQVEYYLYLLRDLCSDFTGVRRLDLHLSDQDREAAASVLAEHFPDGSPSPLIAVAPGAAYGTAKRWPWLRYAELIGRLIDDSGAGIILIGSKLEQEVTGRIASQVAQRRPEAASRLVNTCGRLQLKASAALLARCHAFVTNDSGAMHLAAALDVPQVAIFGPTDWRTTPPYSAAACIVRDPTECAPCLLRHCPIDHRCMEKIGVDRVYAEVCRLLDIKAA